MCELCLSKGESCIQNEIQTGNDAHPLEEAPQCTTLYMTQLYKLSSVQTSNFYFGGLHRVSLLLEHTHAKNPEAAPRSLMSCMPPATFPNLKVKPR